MLRFIYIFSVIPLLFMIASDFRDRTVSAWWLAAFAGCGIGISLCRFGKEMALLNWACNAVLVVLMFLWVCIWFLIRYKRILKPLRESIGAGDVLFILVLAFLFPLYEYVFFLVLSFVFSLLWFQSRFVLSIVNGKQSDSDIPLVATMGCIYIMYLFIESGLYGT